MDEDRAILLEIAFMAEIIYWRGPAPFRFVPVPPEHVGALQEAARTVSYGWGMIPVEASLSGTAFTTALFPRDGTYYLPVKVAVQRATGADVGDVVTVEVRVRTRA